MCIPLLMRSNWSSKNEDTLKTGTISQGSLHLLDTEVHY